MPFLSPIDIKRIEYTKLLIREKKAEEFLNNKLLSLEEKNKWEPEYKKILIRLNDLLSEIGHYKPENILYGWNELIQGEQNGNS